MDSAWMNDSPLAPPSPAGDTASPATGHRLSGPRRALRDLERLTSAPRVHLGTWPTPVERVEPPGSAPLLVKRDDESGLGRGGAKARKIEHLVGHLLERGYDELVTVAGNITNLAFDLIPILDDHGIRPTILIADDPPASPDDRERFFHGVRDRVDLIGPGRAEAASRALRAWFAGRAAGRRPFLLLPGASHPACVVGNASGFIEMARQLDEAGAPGPRAVYVSAATGTTVAGFLLAEHALRSAGWPPSRITGVQVYPGPVRTRVRALIRWTEWSLDMTGRVPSERILIDRGELHGGFGRYPQSLADRCARSDEELGFSLDPIFGGKTWSVAVSDANAGGDRPVLFWHCGWTPEWRALGQPLDADGARRRTSGGDGSRVPR